MLIRSAPGVALLVVALGSVASAQFDVAWLTLEPAANRILNPDGTVATQVVVDDSEKD